MARLVVLSGLPGTGKTTLASALAGELGAAYLRVDVVETPLAAAGVEVGPLGYAVVHALARSNLALGTDVVVDLVDPLPETRAVWHEVAAATGARLTAVECVLTDAVEHRRRVESRRPDLPEQRVPTWDEVVRREYVPWDEERDGARLRVDTSRPTHEQLTAVLRAAGSAGD